MSKTVCVIGGGIIGLSTAYYLQKNGCEVTIIDASKTASGASYINAGYITPSHFIPLSHPGIITKGLKWMLDITSPFYIKPRLDRDLIQWLIAFKKTAKPTKVEKAIPVLKTFNLLSRDLYEDILSSNDFKFHYERKGLLMYYKSDKIGEEEWRIGQRGIKEDLTVEHLSLSDIKRLEPNIELNVKGAIYYHSDAHMTPNMYMQEMTAYLKSKAVVFYNETVEDLKTEGNLISKIITNKQEHHADHVVMAAGSWSQKLSQKIGLKIPLQAGKGYAINLKKPTGIKIPSILCEAKVAVTPMQNFTRFAGTMEIGGINHKINPKRVKAIAQAARTYYPKLKIDKGELDNAQCGLRPCSPDGLPYIGKTNTYDNLCIATGHAMMGWSLGPVTGKVISELILKGKSAVDISLFSPDRRF